MSPPSNAKLSSSLSPGSDEFYRILGLSAERVEPSAAGFFGAIHPDDGPCVEGVTGQLRQWEVG